jgi:hypothetical protein
MGGKWGAGVIIAARSDVAGDLLTRDHLAMNDLTAAQVLALSALGEGRPMTNAELSRTVADVGMHLGEDYAAETIQSLAAHGMAERTPAVSLGKYRITERGRAELADRTAHFHESED